MKDQEQLGRAREVSRPVSSRILAVAGLVCCGVLALACSRAAYRRTDAPTPPRAPQLAKPVPTFLDDGRLVTVLAHCDFLLPHLRLAVLEVPSTGGRWMGGDLHVWDRSGAPGGRRSLEELAQTPPVTCEHDLRGCVDITSSTAALGYVRLFTSPATGGYFARPRSGIHDPSPWWLEVIPDSAVDEAFLFGQMDYLDEFSSDGETFRWFGVVRDAEWRSHGFRSPVVDEVDGGYVVTRLLFRASPKVDEICTVEETVSRTGTTSRVVGDREPAPRELDLCLPP